jgi:cytochrome c oxidase subunit 3
MSAFLLVSGGVMYMHQYVGGLFMLTSGFFLVLSSMSIWFRDVIREGTFQGHHTRPVQISLRWSMVLFIVSEVMFFFAFFWAFFWSSLGPNVELGAIWPPVGIEVLSAWDVPLLNTVILLTSGASCTWAHQAILEGNKLNTSLSLSLTVILGLLFTLCQIFEYFDCSFSIADGIYGSTFFMATGFHGFHVLVGTTFIAVCLFRNFRSHFTTRHHFGFEAAAWYWHFVDVVWLFLFISIYYWGAL